MCDRGHIVFRRLDAFAHGALAGIQSCNGLYTLQYMVLWQNILPDICDHVVQVDLSAFAYRSVAEPGMEIFVADQHVQFIAGDGDGDLGVALLTSPQPLSEGE